MCGTHISVEMIYTVDKLESFQSMCRRIILPSIDDYDEILSQLNIEELSVHLNVLCLKYYSNLCHFFDHPIFIADQW